VITVLVTGVGGGGHGRQVLKALRMSQQGYRIVGTDMTAMSMGLYEVDRAAIVPGATDPDYVMALLDLCKCEGVKVLITGSEPELLAVAKHRDEFLSAGVLPLINTPHCLDVCMDKHKTLDFLSNCGLPTPWYQQADTKYPLHIPAYRFPVIVKPSVSSGGSAHVYLAQNNEELSFFVRYVQRQGLSPVVQQYIGSYDQEYTVGVLTDLHDGSLIGSIALRRYNLSGLSNRMRVYKSPSNRYDSGSGNRSGEPYVISSGISQGEVQDFPEVRDVCEQIAIKLGSKGPMNFQCRKDNDRVYVFEINPRFSGTTGMRALLGFNEPDILIRRSLLNEKDIKVEYKKGVVLRGLEERYIELGTSNQGTLL